MQPEGSRRRFLAQLAAALGGAWALGSSSARPRRLRVLVLGGTGNIGPFHVQAAVERGHHVAVFSRGRRRADLPASVEHLIGDRNGDLESIKDRDWDAVLDLATYGPGWVRSLGEALAGRVGHYTFISTVSVYARPESNPGTTEDSPLLIYTGAADPYAIVEHPGTQYGALKALCEREAERQFPGRTLVLRPSYIGGPGDTHGALTYWPLRMEKGGEVLAAGEPSLPVQYIDVRDLAEWAIRMAESEHAGIYNAVGPAEPADLGVLVATASRTAPSPVTVSWVPSVWLAAREDAATWGLLRFWEVSVGHIMRMSNGRALRSGLTTRPLVTTLADTANWHKQQRPEILAEVRTGYRKKADGSGWEPTSLPWPEYLRREKETLAAWRARG